MRIWAWERAERASSITDRTAEGRARGVNVEFYGFVDDLLTRAIDQGLGDEDLANAIGETVPLYDTYEERIKELRDWARGRARPASLDARLVDLFDQRRTR